MTTFKVGEIAILIQDEKTTNKKNMKYDGEEVVVIGPFAWYQVNPTPEDQRRVVKGYIVELVNHDHQLIVEPHELRKKPPMSDIKEPSSKDREIDKVVSWDLCAWRPNRQVVEELERQRVEKTKPAADRDDLGS